MAELRIAGSSSRTPAVRIILPLLLVATAYIAGLFARPVLEGRSPFLIFVLPVLLSVVFGGRVSGVIAGFLSLAAGFSVMPANARFADHGLLQAAIFAVVCGSVGWLSDRLANQQRHAGAAAEQLRLLLEGATQYAIFMVGPRWVVTTWNKGAERIFGRSSQDAIGRHCAIFSSEADAYNAATAEMDLACREGRFTGETWQVRYDGSEFLAEVTVTPIFDAAGALHGFAKVIHDVTDRRASEQALEKREQHLQSILDTVPDAMIVIDVKGEIISFSSAAENLFGYTEIEVLGRNVSLLMPSPDRERHDGYLQRYVDTSVPRIIGIGRIVTGLRADGSTFPMMLSVGEALTSDQRLFTGFVQDLTERREFESRVEELKSELIHVSRLSAMGTMASTLAHELNQPLTAITTYGQAASSMLEAGDAIDKPLMQEVLTEIAGQSLRAGKIVRRLREFVSRGELARTVEDLPKLIDEASALALVGTKEAGISAQFSYAPDATPVLVDAVQIQQVLINLMRNAVEAMQEAPVRRLMVSTSLLDPGTVQVAVCDTGHGIAPEIQANLFEAFNTSKTHGMGLGLSICRTIIEAHGGRISAMPREGGGTEFRFTLLRPLPEGEEGA